MVLYTITVNIVGGSKVLQNFKSGRENQTTSQDLLYHQLMIIKTIFVLFLNSKNVIFEVAKCSISAFADPFKNKIVYYKSKGRILCCSNKKVQSFVFIGAQKDFN
jgi:hypothetical protein